MSSLSHSRLSFLFACLLLSSIAVACSSGGSSSSSAALGGSAKAKSCKNSSLNHPRTAQDDACDQCDAEKCSAEGNAALGTDPNAFGGACGALLACVCDCDKTDSTCLAKCPAETQECKDALDTAKKCELSKCASVCAKDGG